MLRSLFRPRFWLGHLAMVVAVGVAVGLGLWQLDAWSTRRADAAKDITNDKPVALSTLMGGDDPFPGRDLGRPVTFSGEWTGPNTYIAGRELKGVKGYWVVTAAKVDDSDSAVPVVRGFSRVPDAAVPEGRVAVTGWLQATEGSGPLDDDPHDDVLPTMRLASLVDKVDVDLYSAYVVAERALTTAPGGATVPNFLGPVTPSAIPEVSSFTALRNFLYALEWWVFGAFALFVWYRWCRDELESAAEGEDDA